MNLHIKFWILFGINIVPQINKKYNIKLKNEKNIVGADNIRPFWVVEDADPYKKENENFRTIIVGNVFMHSVRCKIVFISGQLFKISRKIPQNP